MPAPIKILLASRSTIALQALQAALAGLRELDARTRTITNGHSDVLHGLTWTPQLVVLRVDAEHLAEITSWAEKLDAARPPLIVVGPPSATEAVRLAFRAGARDFLPEPVKREDLIAAIQRVTSEDARRVAAAPGGRISTFVGVAGGVGTSFVATNVAHLLAAAASQSTALVDLDLNFSPLAHMLDLRPARGLLEAVESVDTLDAHALRGYGARHRSGLHLLCARTGPVALSKDVSTERLSALIKLLAAHHQQVVIDSPHDINPLNALAFGLSGTVFMVLEQTVLHARNAARLLTILKDELGVPREAVRIVLNRYSKNATVSLDDIRRTLDSESVLLVPSQYQRVVDSIDSGLPMFESEPEGPLTRALRQISLLISGEPEPDRKGFLRRALPSLTRS